MKKNVLITGASGLVGRITYAHLSQLSEQYSVYATDIHCGLSARYIMENKLKASKPKFADGRFKPADITKQKELEGLFAERKYDIVIHYAGVLENQSEDKILRVNRKGTEQLLDMCIKHGVKQVIFTSSVMTVTGYFEKEPYSQYIEGFPDNIPSNLPIIDENSPTMPRSIKPTFKAYSLCKIALERHAEALTKTQPISIIAARLFWMNTENAPEGRFMDHIRCSPEDLCQFIDKAIAQGNKIKYATYFVGSVYDHRMPISLKKAEKELGFVPTDYSEDSHQLFPNNEKSKLMK